MPFAYTWPGSPPPDPSWKIFLQVQVNFLVTNLNPRSCFLRQKCSGDLKTIRWLVAGWSERHSKNFENFFDFSKYRIFYSQTMKWPQYTVINVNYLDHDKLLILNEQNEKLMIFQNSSNWVFPNPSSLETDPPESRFGFPENPKNFRFFDDTRKNRNFKNLRIGSSRPPPV